MFKYPVFSYGLDFIKFTSLVEMKFVVGKI